MAAKGSMKRIRWRIKVTVIAIIAAGVILAADMVGTALSARGVVEHSVDLPTLRSAITADSLRAIAILAPRSEDSTWLRHLEGMPGGGQRLQVDRTIRIGRTFNDKNPAHLRSATRIGITPIDSVEGAWHVGKPVVRVESCADYFVDDLSHSLPYLVPRAEGLLREIGATFRDSLEARGGGAYRVKVTSLLRTHSSVRRLRRRNVNATGHSAHLYGTTFDISYSNFICDSDSVPRTTEDLKLLLAEILRDFQKKGYCWVKHERKQSCFHITLRR